MATSATAKSATPAAIVANSQRRSDRVGADVAFARNSTPMFHSCSIQGRIVAEHRLEPPALATVPSGSILVPTRRIASTRSVQLPLCPRICDTKAIALRIALGIAARQGHHHRHVASMLEGVAHAFVK